MNGMHRFLRNGLIGVGLLSMNLATPAVAEGSRGVIRDAEIEDTVRALAQPIFTAAGVDPQAVRIVLVNDDDLNAFVAGGMNLFINTGLLQQADNASEVIGVIAHETGHIAGGHLVRTQDAVNNASTEAILATILGAVAAVGTGNGEAGAAVIMGGQEMARRSFFSYSRTQEASADQAGMSYLERSGLSARGLMDFMEKLKDEELLPENRQTAFVRTHPLTQDRIDAMEHFVEQAKYSDAPVPAVLTERFARMQSKLIGFLQPQQGLLRYKADDDRVSARYGRVIALYRSGRAAEALPLLDKLMTEEPKNPFFKELKGQILFEEGRIREAIPPYREAVVLLPQAALIRTAYAHALLESNDAALLDEAIQNLDASLHQEPKSAASWRFMATAWGRKGDEGMTAYAMAEQAMAKDNRKEAIFYAERAVKLLPRGGAAWQRAEDIRTSPDPKNKKP